MFPETAAAELEANVPAAAIAAAVDVEGAAAAAAAAANTAALKRVAHIDLFLATQWQEDSKAEEMEGGGKEGGGREVAAAKLICLTMVQPAAGLQQIGVKTLVPDKTEPLDGETEGADTMGWMDEEHLAEDSGRGEASCDEQPAPEAELNKLAAAPIAEADAREEALAGEEQTGVAGVGHCYKKASQWHVARHCQMTPVWLSRPLASTRQCPRRRSRYRR